MLVRYIGQKKKCPVRLPIGVKALGEWVRHGSKTVWFEPTADLTEQDARALVALQPDNFQIAEADIHEGLIERSAECVAKEACKAVDGTELAQAMANAPAPKKRGRPKKAATE